jgi:pimeloyl-ACP methyl ester carboxylesterase
MTVPAFRSYGRKPYSVVLVHGGPGAPGSLGTLAHELAGATFVHPIDRCSGDVGNRSGILEHFQTGCSIDGLVAELSSFIEKHAVPPVCLVGHSWGAWLASIVTAVHALIVKKLVLVSSGPFEERYVHFIGERRAARLDPDGYAEYLSLVRKIENGCVSIDDSDTEYTLKRLEELTIRSDNVDSLPSTGTDETVPGIGLDGKAYESIWSEAVRLRKSGRLMEYVRHIRCPVIVLHGRDDPHPYEGVIEPLRDTLPDFEFVLFDRCGHYPWKERQARSRFIEVFAGVCS